MKIITSSLITFILLLGIVSSASATATPVATATQVDSNTFLFDASTSPCKWRYCTFSWRYYGPGVNRLGGTLGFGSTVLFTFTKIGLFQVVVTESEFCAPTGLRACPGSTQVNVSVA